MVSFIEFGGLDELLHGRQAADEAGLQPKGIPFEKRIPLHKEVFRRIVDGNLLELKEESFEAH